MKRISHRLLWALLLGAGVLVSSGVLDVRTALLAGALLEGLTLTLGLWRMGVIVVRYRRNRAAGLPWQAALEDGLATLLPRRAARLVALEPTMWIVFGQWLFRRRPLAANEFSYARRSILGPLLGVSMLSAPVEIFAFELLIPWPPVRALLLLASVYSVIWLLGLVASLRVRPYRLDGTALHVYYGLLAEGTVLYEQIAAVEPGRRKVPGGKQEGLVAAPAEQAAYIACGGRTDLTLHLHAPLVVQGLLAPSPPVTTLHLAVDQPDALAAALRARLVPTTVAPAPTAAAALMLVGV